MPTRQRDFVPSDHPEKVRILVLETDDLHPETQKEADGFGNILGELFKEAGDDHEPSLGIETKIRYIIEDKGGSVPTPEEIGDDIHAILITGSVYDAHSNVHWIVKLMNLIKRKYPLYRPFLPNPQLTTYLYQMKQLLIICIQTSGSIVLTSNSQVSASATKSSAASSAQK